MAPSAAPSRADTVLGTRTVLFGPVTSLRLLPSSRVQVPLPSMARPMCLCGYAEFGPAGVLAVRTLPSSPTDKTKRSDCRKLWQVHSHCVTAGGCLRTHTLSYYAAPMTPLFLSETSVATTISLLVYYGTQRRRGPAAPPVRRGTLDQEGPLYPPLCGLNQVAVSARTSDLRLSMYPPPLPRGWPIITSPPYSVLLSIGPF